MVQRQASIKAFSEEAGPGVGGGWGAAWRGPESGWSLVTVKAESEAGGEAKAAGSPLPSCVIREADTDLVEAK